MYLFCLRTCFFVPSLLICRLYCSKCYYTWGGRNHWNVLLYFWDLALFASCCVLSPVPRLTNYHHRHLSHRTISFQNAHETKKRKKIAQEQVNEWAVSSWYITQPLCSFGWLIPTNMTYKFPCSHSHVGIFGLTNAKIYARLCLDDATAAAVLIVNITNFLFTYNMN